MVISLSTLLARAHRHRNSVLLCAIPSLDFLTPILGEAAAHQKPLVLQVDTTSISSIPFSILLKTLYTITQEWEGNYAIQAIVDTNKEHITSVLEHAVPGLSLAVKVQAATPPSFTGWLTEITHKSGIDVVISVQGSRSLMAISRLVVETGAIGIEVRVLSNRDEARISLQYLQELSKRSRVPLFVEIEQLSPSLLKTLTKAGVNGFSVNESLAQSYTAGIRTGLRNRHEYRPTHYGKYANKALSTTISHYLQLI